MTVDQNSIKIFFKKIIIDKEEELYMKFIIPKEEEKKSSVIKYVAIGAGIVLAIAGILVLIKKLTKKNCVCECDCCCDDDCYCDDECCCDCEEDDECCECECGEHVENAEDLF